MAGCRLGESECQVQNIIFYYYIFHKLHGILLLEAFMKKKEKIELVELPTKNDQLKTYLLRKKALKNKSK